MKFLVRYIVGKNHIRTKNIVAKNLEDAEKICKTKIKKWVDIEMVDKTKGKAEY